MNFNELNKAIGLKDVFNPAGSNDPVLGRLINAIIPIIFVIAGFFLLFQLVSGGFALMFSKGDQRAVEGAKAKVTNGVVGFVILFVAYWLIQLLGVVLKIPVFGQLFS